MLLSTRRDEGMAEIKISLFAEQERETKLGKIGEALGKLAAHVDFAALAAEMTGLRCGQGVSVAVARRPQLN